MFLDPKDSHIKCFPFSSPAADDLSSYLSQSVISFTVNVFDLLLWGAAVKAILFHIGRGI